MSRKATILVTSAAGKTGLPVTKRLREMGHPVRAMVRREDARARRLRDTGAEVIVGDVYAMSDMRRAMTGVQRAYHCVPTAPNGLHFGAVFAAAAREARLEHVVMIGQWLSHAEHPSSFTRDVWLSEEMLKLLPETTLSVVNPGWFADNYFMVMGLAAQLGILPMPLGVADVKKNAPPSNAAIAAVVAACLSDPSRHAGQTYRPTGPELLSPNDIAEGIGQALGRKVRYLPISDAMFTKALVANPPGNFSLMALSQLAIYVKEYRRGTFAIGAPTDVVATVGGLAPEPFVQTARRAAETRPEVQRGFANKLSAIWGFAKTGLTREPNLQTIMQDRDMPLLAAPSFADENADWLGNHGGGTRASAVA